MNTYVYECRILCWFCFRMADFSFSWSQHSDRSPHALTLTSEIDVNLYLYSRLSPRLWYNLIFANTKLLIYNRRKQQTRVSTGYVLTDTDVGSSFSYPPIIVFIARGPLFSQQNHPSLYNTTMNLIPLLYQSSPLLITTYSMEKRSRFFGTTSSNVMSTCYSCLRLYCLGQFFLITINIVERLRLALWRRTMVFSTKSSSDSRYWWKYVWCLFFTNVHACL